MTKRHKAHKSTLDKGYASEWNADHIDDFTDEIDIETYFITPALIVLWDLGGTTNPVILLQDHHTFSFLNPAAGNGNTSWMRYERGGAPNNITHINDNPTHTCALWMEAYGVTGNVAEFGLLDNAVVSFTANQDGVYFRIRDNQIYAVCGDGAAETEELIGAVPEYGHYRIHLQATKCDFYVDDMETPAKTITDDLPDSDLTIKFAAQNQAGVQTEMYVDACALSMLRYKG